MKNLIEQFSRERLAEIAKDGFLQHGESKLLAKISLELQDAPGKIYQIRKLDGSEEWQQWEEVDEGEYHASVSSEGWDRRILYTAAVSVSDGWRLVPVEPTQAMLAAFNDSDYGRKSLMERYIGMLAAAPELGADGA